MYRYIQYIVNNSINGYEFPFSINILIYINIHSPDINVAVRKLSYSFCFTSFMII